MLRDFAPWFTKGHVLETNGWWVVHNWMIWVRQCNSKNVKYQENYQKMLSTSQMFFYM